MKIILELIANFILVVGFGILMQAPKNSLLTVGLTGTISWGGFLFANNLTSSIVFSTFIAAIVVGVCGEFFARINQLPATVFIVAGILPLVPGVPAYYMMYHMLEGDYLKGVENAINTLMIAGAISFGIAIVGGAAKYYAELKSSKD
ncbi:MAG: threonine/serine exporter family protein [Bacillota bacterium]